MTIWPDAAPLQTVIGLHVSSCVGLFQQCQHSVLDCWIIADREIFHIIAFQLFSKISDSIEQLGPMGCKNIQLFIFATIREQ